MNRHITEMYEEAPPIVHGGKTVMPVLCLALIFALKTLRNQRSVLTLQWLQMRSLTYLHHHPRDAMLMGGQSHCVLTDKRYQAWRSM